VTRPLSGRCKSLLHPESSPSFFGAGIVSRTHLARASHSSRSGTSPIACQLRPLAQTHQIASVTKGRPSVRDACALERRPTTRWPSHSRSRSGLRSGNRAGCDPSRAVHTGWLATPSVAWAERASPRDDENRLTSAATASPVRTSQLARPRCSVAIAHREQNLRACDSAAGRPNVD